MTDSTTINGIMAVFSVITIVVPTLLAIRMVTPALEKSVAREVALHRDAVIVLQAALARARGDKALSDRLAVQLDCHRAAVRALAPHVLLTDRSRGDADYPRTARV